MTPAEHREFVQAAWRAATPNLLVDYFTKLGGNEATIDDIRKALDLAARATGTDAEKKVDANANLPVFQFTFVNGAVQAKQIEQAVPEAEFTEVPEAEVNWPFAGSKPPVEKPTDDAADPALLAQLDTLLGLD